MDDKSSEHIDKTVSLLEINNGLVVFFKTTVVLLILKMLPLLAENKLPIMQITIPIKCYCACVCGHVCKQVQYMQTVRLPRFHSES